MMMKLGYEIQRQRGSHIRLRKTTLTGEHHITVPFKDEIAKGTLNDILNSISIQNAISKEELLNMLRGG